MYRDPEFAFAFMMGPLVWFFIIIFVVYVVLLTAGRNVVPKLRVCYFGAVTYFFALILPMIGGLLINLFGMMGRSALGEGLEMVSVVLVYAAPILLCISLILLLISLKPDFNSYSRPKPMPSKPEKPTETPDPFQ